jgi:hypothetical protein
VKQLPTLVPLITEMLNLFKALLPELKKLLPPLTELFALVLAKFLTPLLVTILEEMTKGMVDLLKEAGPTIDAISQWLTDLATWWKENDDIFPRFWKSFKEGAKDVIPVIKEVLGFVVNLVGKIGEAIGLIAKMSDEADERAEGEKREARIQKRFADPRYVAAAYDANTEKLVEQYRRAGRSEKWIAAWRKSREINKQAAVAMARTKSISLEKKGEGGYIPSRQVVIAGERTPEWIVPDTPAGLAKYLPQMVESVMGRAGGGAAGGGTQNSLLMAIRDELRAMLNVLESIADEGSNPLPRTLS